MQTNVYRILMIVSFSLCGGFLITAVILFFKLKIKHLIDELSGRSARKQVEEIRKENTNVKNRGYVSGFFGSRDTKGLKNTENLTAKTEHITEEIDIDVSEGTVLLNDVRNDDENTGTSILSIDEDEEGTTILANDDEETTILSNNEGNTETVGNSSNVIKEIVVTESEDYLRI